MGTDRHCTCSRSANTSGQRRAILYLTLVARPRPSGQDPL